MNLKNYTSDVPAYTSMGLIERSLVEAGATDISKRYENNVCVGMKFRMLVNNTPMFFELPAKVEKCFEVMYREVKRPRADTKQRVRKQAEKTAWKIMHDWVAVQLSMIMLEQAEAIEVFLPYVYDPATNQTFFNKLKDGGFKMLPSSVK